MNKYTLKFQNTSLESLYFNSQQGNILSFFCRTYMFFIIGNLIRIIQFLVIGIEKEFWYTSIFLLKTLIEYVYITKWKQQYAIYVISYNNIILAFATYFVIQPQYLEHYGGSTMFIVATILALVNQALIIAPDFLLNSVIIMIINLIKCGCIIILYENPISLILIVISLYICYQSYIQENARRLLFLSTQKNLLWDGIISSMLNETILFVGFDDVNLEFQLKNLNKIDTNIQFEIKDNQSLRNFLRELMIINQNKNLETALFEIMNNKVPEQLNDLYYFDCQAQNVFFSISVHYSNLDEKRFLMILDNRSKKKKIDFYIQKSQKLFDLLKQIIRRRVEQLRTQLKVLISYKSFLSDKSDYQHIIYQLTIEYYQCKILELKTSHKPIKIINLQTFNFLSVINYIFRIMYYQAHIKDKRLIFRVGPQIISQQITTNKFLFISTMLNIIKYGIEKTSSKIITLQIDYLKHRNTYYFEFILKIDDIISQKDRNVTTLTYLAFQQAKDNVKLLGPFHRINGKNSYLQFLIIRNINFNLI